MSYGRPLYIELPITPTHRSIHRIHEGGDRLINNDPVFVHALMFVQGRRLITEATLTAMGLTISPIQRQFCTVAELIRDRVQAVVHFALPTASEPCPVDVHRLPLPPSNSRFALIHPDGHFRDPTSGAPMDNSYGYSDVLIQPMPGFYGIPCTSIKPGYFKIGPKP